MKHCSVKIPAVMLVPADHRVFARCPALNETPGIFGYKMQKEKTKQQICHHKSMFYQIVLRF